MKVHFLKSWSEYFNALEVGTKTFDLRHNDRGYFAGDAIVFEEFKPPHPHEQMVTDDRGNLMTPEAIEASRYTGRQIVRTISRIDRLTDLPACGGITSTSAAENPRKLVILSLRRVDESDFMTYANEQRGAK